MHTYFPHFEVALFITFFLVCRPKIVFLLTDFYNYNHIRCEIFLKTFKLILETLKAKFKKNAKKKLKWIFISIILLKKGTIIMNKISIIFCKIIFLFFIIFLAFNKF